MSDGSALLPTFATERLLLRAVAPADIPYYEKHFIDYEVISHLSSAVPWPYPPNGVSDFLNQFIFPAQGRDQWLWGIFEKQNPSELIGVVHLWREGRPENRGFWLGKPFWGKGYMTEAVGPVMDYAFNSLGFDKLTFANAVGNEKSRRVKEKTGARLLEVKPAKFVNPTYTEHEVWELTADDWKKTRGNLSFIEIKTIDQSLFEEAKKFYESVGYLGGIQPDDIVVGAFLNSQMIGVVRLAFENSFVVLRGMQVLEKFQRRGIGALIIQKLESHIKEECFCLPYDWLEGFYGQIGFIKIDPQQAPDHLKKRFHENQKKHPHLIVMKRNIAEYSK